MTQEQITENNKLIGEFMKPSWYDKRRKDYPFPFPVIEIVPEDDIIGYGKVPEGEIKHFSGQPDIMKYHTDWNWIMSVVSKIESLGYYVMINRWVVIYTSEQDDAKEIIALYQRKIPKIEMTWLAVVDFIEWFNKQNK